MNNEIEKSNRRITVIIDPHIKANPSYNVYAEGLNLTKNQTEGNLTNIFVKNA